MKKIISLCITIAMVLQCMSAFSNELAETNEVLTDSDALLISEASDTATLSSVDEQTDNADDEIAEEIEESEISSGNTYYSPTDEENWQQYCEQTMNAYRAVVKDPGLISDEKYFGVYDSESETWTTESLLDYERCPELGAIYEAVKVGDYAIAKAELLEYYREKFSSYTFPEVTDNRNNSILKMNNIYDGSAIDIEKITQNEGWYGFDLTGNVSITERVKKVAFLVSELNKDGLMAEFNSKENEENRPYLELSVDGRTRRFYPLADTTMYSGAFESISYGDNEKIAVCESYSSIGSGERKNKYTSRGALMFDLSELSASVSIDSTTLYLYGKCLKSEDPSAPACDKDFCDVYVSKASNVNWTEEDSSWEAILGIGGGSVSYDGENLSPMLQKNRNGMLNWNTLAAMYAETGDEIYAFHAVRWLAESVDKKSLTDNDTHSLDNGNILRTTIQYISYILYSEHMTPNHFTMVMKWIYEMMEVACNNWTGQHEHNNFGQANCGGVFIVSQVFTEYRICDDPIYNPEPRCEGDNGKAGGWIELGKYRMQYAYVKDMFPDNSCTEVPLSYVHYLNDLIRFVLQWQSYLHYDLSEIVDDNYNINNLKNYELFLFKYSNPVFGCWQQGHDDVYNRNLARGTEYTLGVIDDPQLKYFYTHRLEGEAPDKTSYLFDQSMRAVLRSDWSENAVAAQINANGGDLNSHGQQDDLSLNVFGYGQALIQESTHKDYNYNSDSVTAWLASAKAVNAVEINNQTQRGAHSFMPYTEFDEDIHGSPKGEPGNMHPDKAELNNMYNYLHTESEAYKDHEDVGDDFTYIRDVLFVEPEFFIVVDYMDPLKNKNKVNTYKQYWHFLPEANISLGLDNSVKTNFKNTANIIVAQVEKETATVPNIKTGYWALGSNWTYANYARYDKEQAGTTTFNTVLYPVKKGDNYHVETENIALDVSEGEANAFKFISTDMDSGSSDTTSFYTLFDESKKEEREFSEFSTDGTLALVTENSAGFKRAILRNGTSLEKGNVQVISSDSEISDLGVKWNGDSVELHTSKNVYTEKTAEDEKNVNLVFEKGKTSTGSYNAGHHDLAFDGDRNTAWYSSYNEEKDILFYPSLEADFGENTAFSKVNIYTDGDAQFNIYRSNNGSDWEYVGKTVPGGKVDGKNLCTLECGLEKANYIKASYAEKTAPVVYEFEVYEASKKSIMLDDLSIYSSSKPDYVTINGENTEFSYVDSYIVFGDVQNDEDEDEENDKPESDKNDKPSSSHGSGMGGKKPSSGGSSSVIIPEPSVPSVPDVKMPFKDVNSGDWFCEGVRFCWNEKLFSGVSEEIFAPDDTMTRAMFVTVLHRMSGMQPESKCEFSDVAADSWYYDAVCWATENNIVNGTGNGEFSPDLPVTRQEMAVLLRRYDTFKNGESEMTAYLSDFNDFEDVADWATDAVKWAIKKEIINGDTSGNILPLQSATRAQVAVVIQRYMNK